MNWYQGNIAEAVAKSKANNAIFVVYVEGKDESTQKLSNFINDQKIREKLESDDFVAIKIESDSQSYMQFATIYQVVPVPSIFFIGKSGAPLEIGTGIIASIDELEDKINKVLSASGRGTPSATLSTSFIEAEKIVQQAPANKPLEIIKRPDEAIDASLPSTDASTRGPATGTVSEIKQEEQEQIVCDGNVCYKKPNTEQEIAVADEESKVSTNQNEQNQVDVNTQLEETRKNMDEQRRKRIAEDKQLEKERELRRRQEGKELQNLQQLQREQELKELKENIRREKLEEIAVRERIRAQIAADRAERAQKFALPGEPAVPSSNAATTIAEAADPSGGVPTATPPDSTRIQFRFASGNTATHVFNCQDTLSKLREYVRIDLLPGTGIKDFTLATTYPKRELNVEHDAQTLAELSLFPSAVILIIGKESTSSPAAIIARSGGLLNIFTSLVMTILSPVFSIFGYFKNLATGRRRGNENDKDNNSGATKRANEENGAHHDAAKRRNMERFGGGTMAGTVLGNSPSTSSDAVTERDETKPYRRYGSSNIHRLTDHKDSDDENATWNGNSTQQQ